MARGDDLEVRLIEFGVRIIHVTNHLPKNRAGRHLADQILRCGTAPAAQYAEARAAESRRDFVHKLKIGLKELNETRIWLNMIVRSQMLPAPRLQELCLECEELCRIFGASIRTALSAPESQPRDT